MQTNLDTLSQILKCFCRQVGDNDPCLDQLYLKDNGSSCFIKQKNSTIYNTKTDWRRLKKN